jgi:hypothetical protein
MHLNYGRWCNDNLDKFKEVVQDIHDGKAPAPGYLLGSFDGKNNQREIVGLNPAQLNGQCIVF